MIILSIPIYQNSSDLADSALADWRELRLDYLEEPNQFPLSRIEKDQIITIRDQREGGINFCPLAAKFTYYQRAIASKNCLVDLEFKNYTASIPAANLILSYHDFSENFDLPKLQNLILKSNQLSAKYLKIAVNIQSYSQFTILAKLIKQANKPVILVGMGKLGKLSRLLYKHLGSVGTYIGLAAKPTASGQLSLEEAEIFALATIEKTTQLGGLIGGKQVYHSLGMKYYNKIFQEKSIDACYLPWMVEDFADFWQWLTIEKKMFYGFSITMPHKAEISTQLGIQAKFKARNLYLPTSDQLHNTDALAFIKATQYLKIKQTDIILIVGSGNTAETALATFSHYPNLLISARNKTQANLLAQKYGGDFRALDQLPKQIDLIINCTSLGMQQEDFLKETGLENLFFSSSPIKVIDLPYSQKITSLITLCQENHIPFVDGKLFWQWQAEKQLQLFVQVIHKRSKEK